MWPATSTERTYTVVVAKSDFRRRGRQCRIHPQRQLVHVLQISRVGGRIGSRLAQQLCRALQRRHRGTTLCVRAWTYCGFHRCCGMGSRRSQPICSALPLRIYRMEEIHNVLHDMLVVDDSFLKANNLLHQNSVVHTELVVAIRHVLQLLLRSDELCVKQIDLVRGHHHVFAVGNRSSWCRGLAANVLQRIFVVDLEIRMLKLPSPGAIRTLLIILGVVPDLVKVILVQLANKAGKVAMLEVLREDEFCEFLVLRGQ